MTEETAEGEPCTGPAQPAAHSLPSLQPGTQARRALFTGGDDSGPGQVVTLKGPQILTVKG